MISKEEGGLVVEPESRLPGGGGIWVLLRDKRIGMFVKKCVKNTLKNTKVETFFVLKISS